MGNDNTRSIKLIEDGVKDHMLPIITKIDTTHEFFKALEEMFAINNTTRIITLKDKISNIKMNKGETISSYLMRIIEIRYKIFIIGHLCDAKELTIMTLKGLPTSWNTFRKGVCSRPKFPKLDRLKVDCIQRDCMLESRGIGTTTTKEDIQILSTQVNKRKKNSKGKENI